MYSHVSLGARKMTLADTRGTSRFRNNTIYSPRVGANSYHTLLFYSLIGPIRWQREVRQSLLEDYHAYCLPRNRFAHGGGLRRYTRLDRRLREGGYRPRYATKGCLIPRHASCKAA